MKIDEVLSYDETKAKEKLIKFNTTYKNEDFGHNNLSFITHAVAIKFLYSPQIQKAYYKRKMELADGFSIPDYNALKTGIKKAAQHLKEFRKELDVDAVEQNIVNFINDDVEGFIKALAHGRNVLLEFFVPLTDPEGEYKYYKGDLLGLEVFGRVRMLKN